MPSTDITYTTRANENFTGYLATPDGDDKAPGILLITAIFGIDDVVDPATTRTWITAGVRSLRPVMAPAGWVNRKEKKISYIDTW